MNYRKLSKFRFYKYYGDPNYKGIIFYFHDYGDYIGRNAHISDIFCEKGYDFYGMD